MIRLFHKRNSFFDLLPNDSLLIGDRPYVVEKVARGGMGFVLLLTLDHAKAPERLSALGLKVALKGVLPSVADPEGIALFKRELTIWSAFRHFNVVWLLEIVDGGDAGWLAAMDWCPGSLRDLLKEARRFSYADSAHVMCHLIDGLAYAYEKDRVLHLDLKPENVLYHLNVRSLTDADAISSLEQYRFMVSDWGIASVKQTKLNAIAGQSLTDEATQRTFNNIGTVLYMAPERFSAGFRSSVASDVL